MIVILKNGLGLCPPGSPCLFGAEPRRLLSRQGRTIQFISHVSLRPSFLKAHQLRQSSFQCTICRSAASSLQKHCPCTRLPPTKPLQSRPTAAKRRRGNLPSCPAHPPAGEISLPPVPDFLSSPPKQGHT